MHLVTPRIAVLGVGLIGGSIGLAARERLGAEVVGYDPDAATREAALAHGCRPISATDSSRGGGRGRRGGLLRGAGRRLLPELAASGASRGRAGDDAAITDVGSTKRDIVAALGPPTSTSSAGTRWRGPRRPASPTPAPTSSRQPAGT